MQGVLAALAAGKLKLATLPALVFTLSNTYGARGYCCGAFCELWLLWHASCTPSCRAHVDANQWASQPACPPPPGLIVIIALLGYGLVEIPRIFWRRSFPEARLKYHYHRVGRAAERLTDSRCVST